LQEGLWACFPLPWFCGLTAGYRALFWRAGEKQNNDAVLQPALPLWFEARRHHQATWQAFFSPSRT